MKSNLNTLVIGVVLIPLILAGCGPIAPAIIENTDRPSNTSEATLASTAGPTQTVSEATASATPVVTLGNQVDLERLFSPVWESRQYLREAFVEQPVEDSVLAQGALDGLVASLEDQGIVLEGISVTADVPSAISLSQLARTPQDAAPAFSAFWEAWRKVQYGDAQIRGTYEELLYACLGAMVDALGDPHTSYMDPLQFEQSNIQLGGEYEGIGAFVDTTTEYVTIIAPMEGAPAQRAGLRAGDMIIAVDGTDMTGVSGDVVLTYIMGPAGTPVVLTIQREGEPASFDVEIIRERISVPSVQSEMINGDIAYVQLLTFGDSTDNELRQALEDLLANDPKGLILDLRNNGGGYLHTAVAVTSEFLATRDVILYEEYGDGESDSFYALDGGLATDIPLVVLVNGGTASASEILAGAIQDYDRGVLVGETTYGKGSVQQPVALSNDQGALRITIAHWLTPYRRLIHGLGLIPEYVVALTDEDIEQGLDPQLDKAIELLNAQAFMVN
ncbi:MAG: S41 family peptidase [Anaerolineales bacterium]